MLLYDTNYCHIWNTIVFLHEVNFRWKTMELHSWLWFGTKNIPYMHSQQGNDMQSQCFDNTVGCFVSLHNNAPFARCNPNEFSNQDIIKVVFKKDFLAFFG